MMTRASEPKFSLMQIIIVIIGAIAGGWVSHAYSSSDANSQTRGVVSQHTEQIQSLSQRVDSKVDYGVFKDSYDRIYNKMESIDKKIESIDKKLSRKK